LEGGAGVWSLRGEVGKGAKFGGKVECRRPGIQKGRNLGKKKIFSTDHGSPGTLLKKMLDWKNFSKRKKRPKKIIKTALRGKISTRKL